MTPTGACTRAFRPNRTRSMTLPARIHEDEVPEHKISYCPSNSEDVDEDPPESWQIFARLRGVTLQQASASLRCILRLLHYLI